MSQKPNKDDTKDKATISLPRSLKLMAEQRASDTERDFSGYIRYLIRRDLEAVRDVQPSQAEAPPPAIVGKPPVSNGKKVGFNAALKARINEA